MLIHILRYTQGRTKTEHFVSFSGSYLFTDELLPQKLASLKHVGDVIKRTESFIFVLVLLLNTDGGAMVEKLGRKVGGRRIPRTEK